MINEKFTFFCTESLKPSVSHSEPSQFRLITFQVLDNHMSLVATTQDSKSYNIRTNFSQKGCDKEFSLYKSRGVDQAAHLSKSQRKNVLPFQTKCLNFTSSLFTFYKEPILHSRHFTVFISTLISLREVVPLQNAVCRGLSSNN